MGAVTANNQQSRLAYARSAHTLYSLCDMGWAPNCQQARLGSAIASSAHTLWPVLPFTTLTMAEMNQATGIASPATSFYTVTALHGRGMPREGAAGKG